MRKKIGLVAAVLLWSAAAFAQENYAQYKDIAPKTLIQRSDLSEQQLQAIQRYFEFTLKDAQKSAELQQLLVEKDPKGTYARLVAYRKGATSKTLDGMIAQFEHFLTEFPYEEWQQQPQAKGQEFVYYQVHNSLANAYFTKREVEKFENLCTPFNFKTENEIYRWNLMRAYVFKTLSTDTLSTLSSRLIDELVKKVDDGSYIEEGVFDKEKAALNAHEQLDNELTIHINLMNDLKQYATAKKYFAYLSAGGAFHHADLNQVHMDILRHTGEDAAVLPFLENCARANALTPAMEDTLKTRFALQHPGGDYNQYLASLKSGKEQEELKAEVRENMLNQEYTAFALEDADGNLVRSSDWGNRIVVLDFWATWCKPCIAAFPGMQVLTDKYANDPQVGIYLVGTMQNGDYKAKSVGYIKQQGYHFHLLHDAVDKKTGQQDVVFRSFVPFFNSSGIPRKVILKDGIMRYTAEGYSGSPSKLVDELSYAIELLKAEK